jgi:histone deacetylase 1/2
MKPNLKEKLNIFNVTMVKNMITLSFISFVNKMECHLDSRVLTPPPQNGKAERKIRTLNNIIHTLLAHASLPPSMWHHALHMATYLHNILPHKKLSLQSPTKILYQKDPAYSHLRVFGCLCYPLIPSTSRNKLQAQSTPCVFLGYPSNHRGYKYYELSSRKIFISRHVFYETKSRLLHHLRTHHHQL